MTAFIITLLPFILPAIMAIFAFYSLKSFIINLLGTSFELVYLTSNLAYAGYFLILISLVFFAIIVPILAEKNGKHIRIQKLTMIALTILTVSIFITDLSLSQSKKEVEIINTSADLLSKKITTKEALANLNFDAFNPKDTNIFSLIILGEKTNKTIFKAMVEKTPADLLKRVQKGGYTLLGEAVNRDQKWAVEILLNSKKVGVTDYINKGVGFFALKNSLDLANDNKNIEMRDLLRENFPITLLLPKMGHTSNK